MKTLASAEAARAREMTAWLNIAFYCEEGGVFKRVWGACEKQSMCGLILKVGMRERKVSKPTGRVVNGVRTF